MSNETLVSVADTSPRRIPRKTATQRTTHAHHGSPTNVSIGLTIERCERPPAWEALCHRLLFGRWPVGHPLAASDPPPDATAELPSLSSAAMTIRSDTVANHLSEGLETGRVL